MSVRIERWSVIENADPFCAPECRERHLCGIVYGHPSKEDGKRVTTSRIVGAVGKRIATVSRDYDLGEPDPEYLAYLDKAGIAFDADAPIRMVQR